MPLVTLENQTQSKTADGKSEFLWRIPGIFFALIDGTKIQSIWLWIARITSIY
jgi:hypothetical protein